MRFMVTSWMRAFSPPKALLPGVFKLDKPDFLGKTALQKSKQDGTGRCAYGIVLLEPGIIRDGYPILLEGHAIGTVTSGGYSPTLNQSIALILSCRSLSVGMEVNVQIRNRLCKAKVTKIPFIDKKEGL